MKLLVVVAVGCLLAASVQSHRQKRTYPTRCFPGTHCWPSHEAIAELDDATSGALYQPSDASYRGQVVYVNQRLTPHPGLVFTPASESDVQRGVVFARKFNLLLLVRGANAQSLDYTGRFAVDGAFVIDLSLLTSVSPTQLVTSVDAGSVTVQAGATWQNVYSQLGNSRIVVGTNPQDSVMETTLSGGVSPISRTFGLVSDNLISARVVLADGRLATLNGAGATVTNADGTTSTYDDPELFYAIKGGGFNWAIPVSFTFRLYFPPTQMTFVDGRYNLYVDGNFLGKDALRFVLRELINLPQQWGGYFMLDGSPSTTDPGDKGYFALSLLYYGSGASTDTGVNSISNLINYVPTQVRQFLDVNIQDNIQQYFDASGQKDVFNTKSNSYVFNSLLTRNVFDNTTLFEQFLESLLTVVDAPSVTANKRCIGRLMGGAISSSSRDFDAVSEKMRDAIMSFSCGMLWDDSILRDSYLVDSAIGSSERVAAAYGSGVDPRYAAENLPSWKSEIYGNKYKLLLEVKQRWDIDNFLWTHNGIASDFHLDCRRGRCH